LNIKKINSVVLQIDRFVLFIFSVLIVSVLVFLWRFVSLLRSSIFFFYSIFPTFLFCSVLFYSFIFSSVLPLLVPSLADLYLFYSSIQLSFLLNSLLPFLLHRLSFCQVDKASSFKELLLMWIIMVWGQLITNSSNIN